MKKMGHTYYVHKSALEQLPICALSAVNEAVLCVPDGFAYEVVKYDATTGKVSFIESPDWDTAHEPTVGDSVCVDSATGAVKLIKGRGQIYHHKWQFVGPSYDGFDIVESKARSQQWESIIPRTREVKSRIGYKSYWEDLLQQYNIEL